MPEKELSPLNVASLLRTHGLSPKKSLGQNFLLDQAALQKITEVAEIQPDGEVLEIGPGLGSLTRYLARVAGRVVAVELDGGLIPVLRDILASFSNVELIHGDILKQDPERLMHSAGYRVVANIPYYITSAVIRHLLKSPLRPRSLVLTMQKEVAERICAQPGELSLLALSVQVYGQPKSILRIPAGAFYPPPNVDSMVLKLDLFPQPLIPEDQLDAFFRLAKAGFSQKRKILRNSLSGGLAWKPERAEELLQTARIDPRRRAETLSMDEWKELTGFFSAG